MKQIIKLEQPNCRNCGYVAKFLESNGVSYQTIDVTEQPDKAVKYGIMSVPVTILLDESENELKRSIGFKPDELEEMIEQL
ncbi:thioredoxin family protein [Niallia taxi]|uniref:thioredoxin family protein n=1 Tax=Niallia taxi TaxID=2499688 RepID=UPI00316BD510